MKKLTIFWLLILSSSTLKSQDFSLEAYGGVLDLISGFEDDPKLIPITAGGQEDAARLGNDCAGLVSDRPDMAISYAKGDYELSFGVLSESDTTLVINDPNGNWVCNDDYGISLNPGISFGDPDSGIYDIWVGVYSSSDEYSDATLMVSEMDIDDLFSSYDTFFEDLADFESFEGFDDISSTGGSGTGFVINRSGHILTNYHVVEGCSDISFQIRGEGATQASIISTNETADLALLKIEAFEGLPAQFAYSSETKMGAELFVYGFPLTDDLSAQGNFTNGIVSATSGINDDMTQFQMTAPIQPGNSGGPVLNENGEIIGVVVATANQDFFRTQRGTDTQNINFAIHGAISKRFLDSNNISYEVSANEADSLSVADVASRAQEFTGILLCN